MNLNRFSIFNNDREENIKMRKIAIEKKNALYRH